MKIKEMNGNEQTLQTHMHTFLKKNNNKGNEWQ
jgi:hypothetical protein